MMRDIKEIQIECIALSFRQYFMQTLCKGWSAARFAAYNICKHSGASSEIISPLESQICRYSEGRSLNREHSS